MLLCQTKLKSYLYLFAAAESYCWDYKTVEILEKNLIQFLCDFLQKVKDRADKTFCVYIQFILERKVKITFQGFSMIHSIGTHCF